MSTPFAGPTATSLRRSPRWRAITFSKKARLTLPIGYFRGIGSAKGGGTPQGPWLKTSSRSLRRHDPDQVPRVYPSCGILSALLGFDHVRPVDRITADADARRLTESRLAHRVHDLVRKRATSGDHAGVPFLENEVRDDAHLRLPGRRDPGTVRPDDGDTFAAGVGNEVEAIVERNALRDDHDELDARLDGLHGRILDVRGRNEQD